MWGLRRPVRWASIPIPWSTWIRTTSPRASALRTGPGTVRPSSNYPDIWYVTNGAGHQYNGLTVEALRHFANGLYFQSSWTWARDRYDLDYNWDFDIWQFTAENPFNRKREIGPAQEIPTHRFSSNFIYQLPIGRGRRFAD